MRIIKGILTLICICIGISISAQTVLVSNGSSWSYYDNQNQPPNQGSLDWNDSNYNDNTWSSGNAQLGYGDNDEATQINSATETAYFRHLFSVSDPSIFDGLDLELTYDDGAVIYLNGTEIWRVNMPSGTVSYSTTASSTSSENDFAAITVPNTLLAGANVIAVEVHQASTSSSDISFDFSLEGGISGAVDVTRRPYLQKASPTSMTVRWRTDDPHFQI